MERRNPKAGKMKETRYTHTKIHSPVRSPNRHDKVQITTTDYIRDDTPEWYAEVDREATLIKQRGRGVTPLPPGGGRKTWNNQPEERTSECGTDRNNPHNKFRMVSETGKA